MTSLAFINQFIIGIPIYNSQVIFEAALPYSVGSLY